MRREKLFTNCGEHDRSQETSAITNERRKAVHRGTSAVGGAVCAGEGFAAERRADELDEEVGGGVSGFCGAGKRRPFYGRGRERVCGFVLGRYGGNDGALAGDCCRGHRQASARRHHADVADGRFAVGRRRVETAIWIAVLAVCVDSDGCEPVCDSHCPGDYAAIESARLQLLLSRDRRRVVCDDSRRSGRAAARKYWAASESGGDDAGD